MATKKIEKDLQYYFSTEEKAEIAQELARKTSDLSTVEDQKTQRMAQFKAQIEEIKANINNACKKLNNGFEYRMIECTVDYHTPKWGKKSFFRKDNGDFVSSETMTVDELEALPGLRPGEEINSKKFDEPIQEAEVLMLNEPEPDLELDLVEQTF